MVQYVKLKDIKAGDTVILDDGFTCVDPGPHLVHHDPKADGSGLFVLCRGPYLEDDPETPGKSDRSWPLTHPHFLDGQENEDGTLTGVSAP